MLLGLQGSHSTPPMLSTKLDIWGRNAGGHAAITLSQIEKYGGLLRAMCKSMQLTHNVIKTRQLSDIFVVNKNLQSFPILPLVRKVYAHPFCPRL